MPEGDQEWLWTLYRGIMHHIVIAYNKFIGRDYPVALWYEEVKGATICTSKWNYSDFYYNIIDSVPPTGWINMVNVFILIIIRL